MKRRQNLPITYAVQPSFDEERFTKLRLKVMHNGLNRNNSNFNDEVIEDAKSTLANVPLLAFVKTEDGSDESDFAGHEIEIKVVRDDMKFIYKGRPIGIIPESNNYTYEEDETGKKFVYVDAYVWNNYANEALDIINRDEVKKVSMEIDVADYEYQDNFFDVKKYSYNGVALLGDDVQEGMLGAKAELANYSKDIISEMLFEMKEALKGGENLDKNKNKPNEEELNNSENFESTTEEEETNSTQDQNQGKETENFDSNEGGSAQEEGDEESSNGEEQNEDTNSEDFAKLQEDFNALKEEKEQMEKELKRLKAFEASIVEKAKSDAVQELFSKFEEISELDEVKELAKNSMEMKLSDLEDKLYSLKGRHIGNFTKNNEEKSNEEQDEEKSKSKIDWEKLMFQHEQTEVDGPVWADLIKKEEE